ncbi:MAG: hypothetical protein ACKKL4_02305 [Patescibacteria group bacterium]
MKKLLLIIGIIWIVGFAVYYALNSEDPQIDADQDATTATSTDDVASSSRPTPHENEGNEDNNTDEAMALYCAELKSKIPASADWTIITNIIDGAILSSGDELRGCVYSVNDSYGGWAPFEGQIGSYEVKASDGTSLARGPLPTMGSDWMALATQGASIQYQTNVEFDASGYTEGTLTLHNENASGLAEMDQTVVVDVTFE